MIKRIIACLTICLIITGLISPVFSDASALPQPNWTDPGISEIINISDLTGWMLNGGTYDVSTYTDAESFMNDYYSARTKSRLEGSDYKVKHYYGIEELYYDMGDSAYVNPLDVNRAISSAFRDHVGYGRRFSEQVNDALLSTGNLYDTKIPLLSDIEFANFVGYNHDALRLYSEFFVSDDPGLDQYSPEIRPFADTINYSGFTFLSSRPNWEYNLVGGGKKWKFTTAVAAQSWYSYNSNGISDWNQTNLIGCTIKSSTNNTIDNITISYNGSIYSVSLAVGNYSGPSPMFFSVGNNYRNTGGLRSDNYNLDDFSSGSGNWSTLSNSSSNLLDILNWLSLRVRNVNIYVNDDLLIGIAGNNSNVITPEFPEVIGGEDLPSTTWPVHRPLAPYFITAPSMLQAIQDAIDDDGELDIDDLKPYLTDENGDPVPDPQFDPEPVPIPVPDPVNPDVVPGLPVLPAMPPEMPGFNGVSVLAEIINFTNQSLPTALIVTFWGIVFGIVILGLIKILHK